MNGHGAREDPAPTPFSAGASSSPAAGWRRTATLEQVPRSGPTAGRLSVRVGLLQGAHRRGPPRNAADPSVVSSLVLRAAD